MAVAGLGLALLLPHVTHGQNPYEPQGGEFSILGPVPGDQTHPHLALRGGGGYIVWQDNITDGDGLGISARRLDGSLSGVLSNFRVNEQGAGDQEKPRVALLNNGGTAFIWQGGPQGFQHIYARFLGPDNQWVTGDIRVNTFTDGHQQDPDITVLNNGTVVAVWSSWGQDGSMQGVYARRFSETGAKIGEEFRVNTYTSFNQRNASVAPLNHGGFIIVWVSEHQRFENSVEVYARLFDSKAQAASGEILINTGSYVCANPSVAASPQGGFVVTWAGKRVEERIVSGGEFPGDEGQLVAAEEGDPIAEEDGWDIFARGFTNTGEPRSIEARRINTFTYGDQYAPRVSVLGSDYLAVWTSLGQDGSGAGVFGQFLSANGVRAGQEFRVNTTTVSHQEYPSVASDGTGRYLVAWTSFIGGATSYDLYAQRYAPHEDPLPAPDAPFVHALSHRFLMVSWPEIAGLDITHYELYANGSETPVVVTNNYWRSPGLIPETTHSYQLAYVLAGGRRSPMSEPGAGTLWGWDDTGKNGIPDGLPDDWQRFYFGDDPKKWPSPHEDHDGDGMTVWQEFLAGTDPTDPNSNLRTRLSQTEQGLFLMWNTNPGFIYQVQTSSDLKAWTDLGAPRFAPGTVDSIWIGGEPAAYYRVVRLR